MRVSAAFLAVVAFGVFPLHDGRTAASAVASKPQLIAFVRSHADVEQVYTVRTDGTGLRQLTRGKLNSYGPMWSPDGEWVAITRRKGHDGQADVWVMRRDGTGLKQITKNPAYESAEEWTPDGKRLVVFRQSRAYHWIEVDVRTGRERTLGGLALQVHSPNGKWIAQARPATAGEDEFRHDLWVREVGGRWKRVTQLSTEMYEPQWSRDSRHVVVAADERHPPSGSRRSVLYVCAADGTHLRRIVNIVNLRCSDPQWSPDGTRIVLIGSREKVKDDYFGQVYTVRPDGRDLRRLTKHWGNDYEPQFTWDGRFIVCQSDRAKPHAVEGQSGIYVMRADGSGQRALTGLNKGDFKARLSP